MNCLLEVGLSNAVVATGLALVALAAGRMWKNPALTHALWVLVLVKLVTPPVVSWEVFHLPEQEPALVEVSPTEVSLAADSEQFLQSVSPPQVPSLAPVPVDGDFAEYDATFMDREEDDAWAREGAIETTAEYDESLAALPVPPVSTTAASSEKAALPWTLPLLVVWLTGSVGFILLAASRFWMFRQLLDCARPAPARIASRVERLRARLGLRQSPNTWLIRAPITPLVWCGLTGTHLLLPTKLIRRLSDQQQATLLTHELAHLRRRDHWVRWLELAATVLFWWHPVVWWARHELREAEEQCCDAWVVWALPQAARDYLTAVLETVDFLSEDAKPLPVAASGVGQFKHLQRRFARVLEGSPPKASGWRGRAMVVILAAVLLPLVPTITREGATTAAAGAGDDGGSESTETSAVPPTIPGYGSIADPLRFETQPQSLTPEPARVTTAAFSPDGRWLATGSGFSRIPGEIVLWDRATHKEQLILPQPQGVRSVDFSPDGSMLAAGTFEKTVLLIEVPSGKVRHVLRGHASVANSVAFAPNGKTLASCSLDRSIKLWDVNSGQLKQTLNGHTNYVYSVAFSPDGKWLASGSRDQTVRLWNVEAGESERVLRGHSQPVECVRFSPDGTTLASASWDRTLKLWNVADGKQTMSLQGHPSNVMSVAFSPDGNTLVTGGSGGRVVFWNATNGQNLATQQAHQNQVYDVEFSRDGKTLASASWDTTVKLWDVARRQPQRVLQRVADEKALPILLFAYSPDGATIATVHVDEQDDAAQQTVRLRDAASGKVKQVLTGHADLIRSVAFSPDGKSLATASYDKTVKLWDVASGKVKATLKGHDRWVVTVAFSFDGTLLASGGYDRAICVWDVESGERKARFDAHKAAVQSVAFSPDGKRLASGSSDRKIKLWDTTSWKLLGELAGHKNSVRAVAFSPDSTLLASGGADNALRIWDVENRTERATFSHNDVISSLAFSPGGGTLATASFDRTIRTWDVTKASALQTLSGHTLAVTGVAFAHDGSALYTASLDNSIRSWPLSVPPMSPLAVIPRDNIQVFGLAISPDGRLLATAGKDRLIRIRNAKTGELLKTLNGQGGGVLCTQFFSDSRRLASSSYDGSVRLWDVESGEMITSYEAYSGERAFVRNLAISPDGKLIITGNANGVAMFWDVDERKIVRTLPQEPLPINDVAISPDGSTAVITTGNWKEWQRPGRLVVLDVKSGKQRAVLQHSAEVRGAKFSPNGKRLVSFGPRDAKVWDTATWQQIGSLPGNIRALAYLRDNKTVAIGEIKGQMALLNAENGQVIARLQGHDSLVSTIVSSPDGSYLVSGCHYGWVKLWPTGQGDGSEIVHGWGRRAASHYGLSFQGARADRVVVRKLRYDGSHPITLETVVVPRTMKQGTVLADYQNSGIGLHLWRDGHWKFNVHDGQKYRVASSDAKAVPGKKVHLVGVFDGSNVRLFVDGRLQKQVERASKVKPSGLPFYVGANPKPDGGAHAGFDGRIDAVRISNVARYAAGFAPPKSFQRDDHTLVLYHFAEGGGNLVRDASGRGYDGLVTGGTWEDLLGGSAPRTLTAAATLKADEADVWFARFSPDGKRLATGGNDRIVKMWDATSRKLVWQSAGHRSGVTCAAFSRDGKRLATGSWDRSIRIWEAATGKLITSVEGHTGGIRGVVFSRDGRLISCGEDKQVILWDVSTGKASRRLEHDLPVYSVDISPDGKLLATGTGNWKEKVNGLIRLWDADSGKLITTFKGSEGLVLSLAFTPDGERLVAANAGAGVAVWDIKKRALVANLWPDLSIRPIAISRDGQRIAAGMRNGTRCWARVWNAKTGNLEAILNGHEKLLFSTDFSPDGNRLVTASGDGTVRFWDLGKNAPMAAKTPAAAAASGGGAESEGAGDSSPRRR